MMNKQGGMNFLSFIQEIVNDLESDYKSKTSSRTCFGAT